MTWTGSENARQRAWALGDKRLRDKRAAGQPAGGFWDDIETARALSHTIPFRERDEFKRGRTAEQLVAQWLTEQGWYVIPSYDYGGTNGDKAPSLIGLLNSYAVPDLDISRAGVRRWVEVKLKAGADWTHITQQFEHGIHYRLLEHYRNVELITGSECWLAIYEENSSWLIGQSLAKLGDPRRSTMNGTPMAYWPQAAFRRLKQFNPPTD